MFFSVLLKYITTVETWLSCNKKLDYPDFNSDLGLTINVRVHALNRPEQKQQYKYSPCSNNILSKWQGRLARLATMPPKRWLDLATMQSHSKVHLKLCWAGSTTAQHPWSMTSRQSTVRSCFFKGEPPSKKVKNANATQLNRLHSVLQYILYWWSIIWIFSFPEWARSQWIWIIEFLLYWVIPFIVVTLWLPKMCNLSFSELSGPPCCKRSLGCGNHLGEEWTRGAGRGLLQVCEAGC